MVIKEGILHMPRKMRIGRELSRNLMKQLVRAKYKSPGTLARILLEGFVFDDGILSSETFYHYKITPPGTFTQFREKLKRDDFITYTEASVAKMKYFPTRRIAEFVRIARDESSVTLDYVDKRVGLVDHRVDLVVDEMGARFKEKADLDLVKELQAKLAEHDERFSRIEDLTVQLRRAIEPPDDAEKEAARKIIPKKIQELTNRSKPN